MANKFTSLQHYQDIANAIRFMNGLTRTYTPPQMAQAILDLTIGDGELPEIQSLEILSPPLKTEYAVGEPFTSYGLKVKAIYTNGFYKYVTDDVTLSFANGYIFTTSDVGKSLTVSYEGLSVVINLSIAIKIYGITWPGNSSPTATRTDDSIGLDEPVAATLEVQGSSPFDNILPWSGMKIVEDVNAGTLVKIPKFYYKFVRTGTQLDIKISMVKQSGYLCSPAHLDRGDGVGERNFVYIGRYHCAQDTFKSTSGKLPQVSMTRADFRTNIHNLGSDIWQNDYAIRVTLWLLFLVEFSNFDSQVTIGHGGGGSGGVYANGHTDDSNYRTGKNAATNTYDDIQYRWIEGLWSNCYDFLDGMRYSGNNMYAILNPNQFSDTANGTLVGTRSASRSWVTNFIIPETQGYEWFLYPEVAGNSQYIGDYHNYDSSSGVSMVVGGYYSYSNNSGIFAMYDSIPSSTTNAMYGSRLMKLPDNRKQVDSIEITSMPSKTNYDINDTFDKTGMVIIARYDDGSSANVTDDCSIVIDRSGATITYQYNTFIVEERINLNVTYNGKSIPTWKDATNTEIASIVSDAQKGLIDLTKIWSVGDERTVHLNSMAATGVGESHTEMNVTMVLMDANNSNYTYTTTPSSGRTHPFFIVGQKNGTYGATGSGGTGYMNSSNTNTGSWSSTARRTWCNEVYRNAIDDDLIGIFHQVKVKTGAVSNGTILQETNDYFFLPAIKEIFGGVTATAAGSNTKYSNLTEFNSLSQFEYYANDPSRISKYYSDLSTSLNYYWTRSPYYSGSSQFCTAQTSTLSSAANANSVYSIAPCGAI